MQMRRFSSIILVAIMIIMLPLRGLMGDAMAVQMGTAHLAQAAASASATHLVAALEYSTLASGQFNQKTVASKAATKPCHTVAGLDVQTVDDAAPQKASSTQNTTCTSCQVCHLSAVTVDRVASVAVVLAQAPLAFAPQYWVSAELSQLTKPPVL